MILADTSAWVEFDRATGSAVDRRMAELIAAEAPALRVVEPPAPAPARQGTLFGE